MPQDVLHDLPPDVLVEPPKAALRQRTAVLDEDVVSSPPPTSPPPTSPPPKG